MKAADDSIDANDEIQLARRLLAIQAFSGLAQWIDIFLLFTVPSFLWKSSPAEIAFLAASFALPSLFLGPFIGALLDRSNPGNVMMAATIARTLLTATIAFAPGFWFFGGLFILKGLANLAYWPASAILTNKIVRARTRVKYFSSLSALDQITKIGTPLMAGALTLFINSQMIFIVSAALTLCCAGLLRYIKPIAASMDAIADARPHRSDDGLFKSIAFGVRSILNLPGSLRFSILLGIGLSFGLAIYDPHLAGFLSSKGFEPAVFSMVISATGAGAVFGAALVRFIFNKASPAAMICAGTAVFSAAVCGAAANIYFTPGSLGIVNLIFLWFLNGLGYEVFVIGAAINMQSLCPQALLGRISTTARSAQMAALISGPGIGAWLIATYSRAAPFYLSAAFAVGLLLMAMMFQVMSARRVGRPVLK